MSRRSRLSSATSEKNDPLLNLSKPSDAKNTGPPTEADVKRERERLKKGFYFNTTP